MIEKFVKAGNRIEITVPQNNADKVYISKIEEVLEDDQILIYAPLSFGVLVKLSTGKRYDFVFNTEDGVYKAAGKVVSHMQRDGMVMSVCKLEQNFEKIQRREFFRFRCVIPFSYIYLGELDEDTLTEYDIQIASQIYKHVPQCDGIIKDICGGGARFVTNSDIEISKFVQSVIQLNDTYVVLTTKILYREEFPAGNFQYELRGRFVNITKIDQEKIIQYIFDEQRRILQRQRATGAAAVKK